MLDGNDKRAGLSVDELHLLESRILPTAARWVRDFPEGSVLHRQGLQTLQYWGEDAA